MQDGVILAWKGTHETNLTFQLAATLTGHTQGITSLVVGGGNRLCSGSKDHTIRVSFFSLRIFFFLLFYLFLLLVVSIRRELDYLRSLVLSSALLASSILEGLCLDSISFRPGADLLLKRFCIVLVRNFPFSNLALNQYDVLPFMYFAGNNNISLF